jgi:rare lipoprotein A
MKRVGSATEPPLVCHIRCHNSPYPLWLSNGEWDNLMSNKALAASGLALASGLMLAASALPASAQCGRASWYALNSKTASGERMNPSAMTAAHRSLPLGTKVKVTNQRNGRTVVVRINDRGPFVRGRILDLSRGAAQKLGFISSGHTSVCMISF